MKLKEGIIVRPFGPMSKLEGEVSAQVGEWLIKKGLVTEEDFEPTPEVDPEEAAKAAQAAADALAAEEAAKAKEAEEAAKAKTDSKPRAKKSK